jgi:hypothetical protein
MQATLLTEQNASGPGVKKVTPFLLCHFPSSMLESSWNLPGAKLSIASIGIVVAKRSFVMKMSEVVSFVPLQTHPLGSQEN